jgi:hypothetical protein
MPRTCLACSSPEREAIDKALVAGEPFRNIAKHVSISPAALFRHKNHVANAIGKAQAQHEERLGETLLDEMRRVQRKAWELLARTEAEGDHRASIVALREVRECLESLGDMLENARRVGFLRGFYWDLLKPWPKRPEERLRARSRRPAGHAYRKRLFL